MGLYDSYILRSWVKTRSRSSMCKTLPRTHHPPHDSCPHSLSFHFWDMCCVFLFDVQQQHNSNQPDELHLEHRAQFSSDGCGRQKLETRVFWGKCGVGAGWSTNAPPPPGQDTRQSVPITAHATWYPKLLTSAQTLHLSAQTGSSGEMWSWLGMASTEGSPISWALISGFPCRIQKVTTSLAPPLPLHTWHLDEGSLTQP